VLPPKLHKCDIVFVCKSALVLMMMMIYKDRKVWVLTRDKSKRSMIQAQKQQQSTQDPKIQEEIHRWTAWFILVLNSAVMRMLLLALFQSVFSIVKKVALKCKDIPSHSRLRMNSSKSG